MEVNHTCPSLSVRIPCFGFKIHEASTLGEKTLGKMTLCIIAIIVAVYRILALSYAKIYNAYAESQYAEC
jgi:hypothetical protein